MDSTDSPAPTSHRPATGRVWFVTGTSSGFGRAIAETVLAQGDTLVATARRPGELADLVARAPERAVALELDVTDQDRIRGAVREAVDRFGRIDVLVNNAGRGVLGALEETGDAELRRLFELNVFGPISLTRAVLPHMRRRRAGTIVQMSSIAGLVGYPGHTAYSATKFALEGMSAALAAETAPFGIRVLLVEPGAFRTDFAGPALVTAQPIPDYEASMGAMRAFFDDAHGRQPGDPQKAAAAIHATVATEAPPLRLVLGDDAFDAARDQLLRTEKELRDWEQVSRSTGFAPEA